MTQRSFLLLLLCAGCLPVARVSAATDADIPVAPIAATNFLGWTNAFVLQNGVMKVVVTPCIGRIAQISFGGGDNLLRLDANLHGRVPPTNNMERWMNYGGDWLWPVAQSRWTSMTHADPGFAGSSAEASWPPPVVLADRPWTGTAWRDADGAQSCTLTREYGAPLNIKVSRLIKLDKGAARLTIRQCIERTAASDIPVVLWNVSQIGGASRVILPQDSVLSFEKGLRSLLFAAPGEDRLTGCESAAVYDATAGEHKLCSESKRAWIAALKGNTLIVERTADGDEGKHPDGGCAVEMYSNAGLGYAEIENLGVEKILRPGESLQNSLTIECLAAETNTTACGLADEVRRALGEAAPVK
jgi:hypothetical protein